MDPSEIRVLIVDDDEMLSLALSRYLQKRGYAVRIAVDESHWNQEIEKRPDVVLLDLHLGSRSGVELLPVIFKGEPQTIVIMLSADATPQDIFVGLFEGADDFLLKPVVLDELEIRIRNLVRKRSYLRDVHQVTRKLEQERRLLLRYFSPQTAEVLLSGMFDANLRGGLHEATVLFFGLDNVASRFSAMSAGEFAGHFNAMFGDIMDYVSVNNGAVNKVTGTGILATFGLPFADEKDATNAVSTARSIQAHLLTWNSMVGEEGSVSFGLGIASGKIFAGNMGSEDRMEYSVIGDTVNIAARLESLARTHKNKILCDLWTLERAGMQGQVTPTGVHVKGRKGEIPVCML